jgi:hypothetical protein
MLVFSSVIAVLIAVTFLIWLIAKWVPSLASRIIEISSAGLALAVQVAALECPAERVVVEHRRAPQFTASWEATRTSGSSYVMK